MDILGKLRGLESGLARTVDAAAQMMTQAGPREPLEILHALIAEVEKRIEPAGRGKYVFPFNRIRISIVAGSPEMCARFEAVLESDPPLKDRIVQTLQDAGCVRADVSVHTTYVDHPEARWATPNFDVEFDRITVPPQTRPQTNEAHHRLRLTAVQGATEQATYLFTTSR